MENFIFCVVYYPAFQNVRSITQDKKHKKIFPKVPVIGFCKSHTIGMSVTRSSTTSRPHTKRKILTQLSKFHLFVYFLTLTKKSVGEPLSCATKLNPKSRSYLFPKKTSIPFGFTRSIIWDANLLAFSHSAKPKRENQESRRKEIWSCNNVYVYMFMYFYRGYHTELTDRMCGKNGTLFTSKKV